MAATVQELHTGRKNAYRSAERLYRVFNVTDETDARADFLAAVPSSVDGKPLNYIDSSVEEFDQGVFIGTAIYSLNVVEYVTPDSFSYSFDISGQAQRITQSLSTIGGYAPTSKPVKDFSGAIGVCQDGSVEGTDIIVPYLTYVVNYTMDSEDVTATYRNVTLPSIVGKVNSDTYNGASAGELLLTGASGQPLDTGDWAMQFKFAISQNETDIVIGAGTNQITISAKQGWDYLWVYQEEREESTNHYLRKVPVCAYVERVFKRAAYSGLGLTLS